MKIFTLILLVMLPVHTFAMPDDTGCSRSWAGVPRPFISEERTMYLSAAKMWLLGGEGEVSVEDFIHGTFKIYDTGTKEELNAVYFPDDRIGFVVGLNGTIAKSEDGGITWKKQKSGTMQTLRSIYCIDTLNCWISGNEGTILKTSNGGRTWNSSKIDTEEKMKAIRFIDANMGFVIGDDEIVYKTVDGGAAWEAKKIPFRDDGSKDHYSLRNLAVRDANTYCISTVGVVACTKDDGKNWRIEYFEDNVGRDFVGISVSSDIFYLIGKCGDHEDAVMDGAFGIWKTKSEKANR